MTERREHFALDWLKRELDETLKAARLALEAYAESKGDETRMRACLTHLHQVHGTLLMLELTGVTVLSDEMEQLAQALLLGKVREPVAAQQALMQAILQLPAFLEEIQKGLPDSRRAVLPLANELRLARGGKPFPDVPGSATARSGAATSEEGVRRFEQIDGTEKARKIRAAYQQVLLSILRGQDRNAALATLAKVALGLERISDKTPVELLWRAFGIFVKSLVAHRADLSGDVVKLLRRVDAEMKALAQDGRAALERPVDLELVRLLVDDAKSRGYASDDLARLLGEIDVGPEEERLGISRREAMQTAAAALREEIALVKDRLDLFVRGERRSVVDLQALAAPLKQIGSTLSILGFESSRAIVADQVETINTLVEDGALDEGMLLQAASALLQVDENLAALAQERNHRLGGHVEASAVIGAAQVAVIAEARNGLEQVKQAVVDYVSAQWDRRHLEGVPGLLGAVAGALAMVPLAQAADQLGRASRYVGEQLLAGATPDWTALDNFADAISGVDYFLERLSEDASVPAQDVLGGVERSLASLGYGVGMVPPAAPRPEAPTELPVVAAAPQDEVSAGAAEASVAAEDFAVDALESEGPESEDIVAQAEDVEQWDAAAEADAADFGAARSESDEVPMQRLRLVLDESADDEMNPAAPISVDEVEEEAFDLGSGVFDEVTADASNEPHGGTDAMVASWKPAMVPTTPQGGRGPHLETAEAAPMRAEPVAARARPSVTVDDDIVEIFAEEVGEVLETINEWLPQWLADLGDETALTEVRRSFHTLKGSGRIVGASVIGELAWAVENMLNRVIDGTIPASEQIGRVTREAIVLIPVLRADFESRRSSDETAVAAIMERADVLASGGSLEDVAPTVVTQAPVGSTVPVTTPAPAATQATSQAAEEDETFALFEEEAATHLDLLEARIGAADMAGILDEEVLRALHTLRGSAGMAGIEAVSRIADPVYRVASAAREAGVAPTPNMIDFIQQGVFALRRTVKALRDGEVPDEEFGLFEQEAARLVAGFAGEGTRASALLHLEGTPALVDAHRFLDAWRDGAMDLATLSDTIAALHELRNEAESQSLDSMTELCDALLGTYERFEDQPLSESAFGAFDAAHECLLNMFDCIAAEQSLPDAAPCIAALHALDASVVTEITSIEADEVQPAAVAEANEDLIELPELPEPEVLLELPEVEETPDVTAAGDLAEATVIPTRSTEPIEAPEAAVDAGVPTLEARVEVPPVSPGEPASTAALPEDADLEILGIFFEEADEILEAMDHGIQDWIGDRGNRLHAEKLLRALHTLKGGARLAGLKDLGEDTHTLESFVIAAGGAEPDDAFFAALHDRHDAIAGQVQAIKRAAAGAAVEVGPAPAASRVAHTPAPVPGESTTPAAEPPRIAASVAAEKAGEDAEESESDTVAAGRGSGDLASAARMAQEASEMVRVSPQLLEQLVDLAGESSIVRSRVEQGISDFAAALKEMEITIERVREQLRRLEIETETQVLFRREVSHGTDYDEFDPLEMDRYSQLQQLSRALSESASDMFDLKETLANKSREAETLLLQQARLNTEIQEGLMRTRMVPFSRLVPRLRRIVRQVAKDLGKDVEFHAFNAEGELDRNVLERMVPPLEHMLRNAVDHGIERPELRRAYGKPQVGRIDLRLSREGADVLIEITDDGGGIDVESVRAKAVERGLMAPDAELKDDEILQFVLAPGFSTAREVTQISGRGVGMDVVHSAVKQLGGSIGIMSNPGRGSRFLIRLPFTVSVNRALMVSVGEDLYAVPLNTIEGIVRISARELESLYKPGGSGFEYAGIQYRIRYLGSFLGREYNHGAQRGSVPVVLVRAGDRAVAVHVDGVQGSREIVVKSLGPQFAGVGGISGATILGDGSVVVILDLLSLIRTQTASLVTVPAPPKEQRPTCVMVVDDSVTVRKVTSRLLERQGMDVMLAKDGVEAIAMLQERRPDIVLLDIEMPRMDGFEVARQIRHDERLKRLPIIMITSRTGSKHQERALEIGVNRFLGKPFQENELLAGIDDLVHGTRGR